jgi:hypothetical protein
MSDLNPYAPPEADGSAKPGRRSRFANAIGCAGLFSAVAYWAVGLLQPGGPYTTTQRQVYITVLFGSGFLAVILGGIGAVRTRRAVYGYAALTGILELVLVWVAMHVA